MRRPKRGIGAGDEVFATGLFVNASGENRNLPIVRMGNIALMPDEKIPFKKLGMIDGYLVESCSIGGLSGSPVFVRETTGIKILKRDEVLPPGKQRYLHGGGAFFFLGCMIGHWDVPLDFGDIQPEAVNMGISVVVPAVKILEIINQPELVYMRKEVEEEIRKEDESGTLDSAFDGGSEAKTFSKEDFDAALKKASRKVTPKK